MAVESLPLYPTLGLGSHFLPVAAPSVPFPFDSLPCLDFFTTPLEASILNSAFHFLSLLYDHDDFVMTFCLHALYGLDHNALNDWGGGLIWAVSVVGQSTYMYQKSEVGVTAFTGDVEFS